MKKRIIAIHLPQFHPFKENDEWWGKGFTEWTNVTKAQPRFEGHYQPHLPSDLGFYDLRLEEARLAQEQLAKAYGIHGFCYYHYWFNGKRVLHEPLDRKMQNPKENLPFMMCWANENWTRTWDGADHQVLLKQEYSFEDDLVHIKHLINLFRDTRYIKVSGKPIFIIYRPKLLPDIKKTIAIWRKAVQEAGFPDLYAVVYPLCCSHCRCQAGTGRWPGCTGCGTDAVRHCLGCGVCRALCRGFAGGGIRAAHSPVTLFSLNP